ncbi:hypothetical protein Hanom_Chr06g00556741 [Helianthus anomalus]
MATVPKRAGEELWYLQIVKKFVFPRDEDLAAQPPNSTRALTNLGIGPEKKRRAPAVNVAPKKTDTVKAQSSKVKNVKGEKKGTRHSSDSWCDYVVVSDSLEGLAPIVMKKPKAKPRDAADIPASNADGPIDLESSPEPLLRTKAKKRKQTEVEAEGQPAKKVQRKNITRGAILIPLLRNLLLVKNSASFVHAEPSSAANEELPPSSPHAPISEQLESSKAAEDEAEKIIEAENPEVEKLVEVESEKTVNPEIADAGHPMSPEVVGTFPHAEIKFQEDRAQEQAYHAYLEESARYTSTTHRIVHEWRSMCKEWAANEESKKKFAEDEARVALLKATLEANWAKFENDLKTEEWSVSGWKRKVEAKAALLSKEHKNWREICEKDNKEKIDADIERLKQEKAEAEAARDEAPSHKERSEQREEQLKAKVESAKKDLELERTEKAETSRSLAETEEKLESSETARAMAKSELKPLKNDMLWLKDHGIIRIAESVLNSEELEKTVAHLLVATRNAGYAQGYSECSHHVVSALKADWDISRSAMRGADTEAALPAANTQFNTLHLLIMDLFTAALQSEEFVTRLREVFPDMEEDEDLA